MIRNFLYAYFKSGNAHPIRIPLLSKLLSLYRLEPSYNNIGKSVKQQVCHSIESMSKGPFLRPDKWGLGPDE